MIWAWRETGHQTQRKVLTVRKEAAKSWLVAEALEKRKGTSKVVPRVN